MSVPLSQTIRTCKVDVAYADRVQSDRFLNPANMVCPVWNGVDTAGRRVSPDSFVTKSAGCNSAEDRVVVENNQRPQYMEYINLSANGIQGDVYGSLGGSKEMYGDTMEWADTGVYNDRFNYPSDHEKCVNGTGDYYSCMNNVNNVTGSFNTQMSKQIYPSCGYSRYDQAMAQEQQALRQRAALNEGFINNYYKRASGF
jgi:hypothetical protein